MVGYSRLIGLEDIGTLERLRALRTSLIDPTIAEYGGRIVNTGGDFLLIVFDSIDGAVRCAVRVQHRCPSTTAPVDRRTSSGGNGGDGSLPIAFAGIWEAGSRRPASGCRPRDDHN